MLMKRLLGALCIGVLASCASLGDVAAPQEGANARFDWFEYAGHDQVFETPLAEGEYRNPILAGFYPDPSIVRVGQDYYLINSTFGFYPGIPIFHSRDLVNWTQIGNVLDRPDMMPFDRLNLSHAGVYAPSINHHDGTFYVINTCIGCGGNFVVTATNPAGPWSDPIWLPHIHGIDPSIFFDDDGKVYVVHERDPLVKHFPAHTAVWLMEVDPVTFASRSEDVMLLETDLSAPWHTEYIEGPHLYKVDGRYYLSAAGGGTGYYHGQLTFRSTRPFGPYEANPNNPILTQFGLPDDRPNPVTATGHADLVQDAAGDWWAVFLGTRVYDLTTPPQDPGNFHTGRETFMLPVTWRNGWPVVLDHGVSVPYTASGPRFPRTEAPPRPTTGNFTIREDFTEPALGLHWLFARTPHSQWWRTGNGRLVIESRPDRMGDNQQPSFIGQRVAHMTASVTTRMTFIPSHGAEAGLMAVQNDEHYYAFGLTQSAAGETVLRVRRRAGSTDPARGQRIAERVVRASAGRPIYLRISIDRAEVDFSYSLDGRAYDVLIDNAEARPLTTVGAGGFNGAIVGMYAESADGDGS
jgi:alpha-N-arabinofuranosidase